MTMAEQVLAGIVLTAAALGALTAFWKAFCRGRSAWRSGRREVSAVRDAILGRDAVVDSITGKEIAPALPGMGVRMAHQEQQMSLLTDAVAKIADSHGRLEAVEHRVAEHDEAINELRAAAMERVIARAESAQAWSAIEAVVKAKPDADPESE